MFEMDRSAEVIDNYEYEVRNLLKKLKIQRCSWDRREDVFSKDI